MTHRLTAARRPLPARRPTHTRRRRARETAHKRAHPVHSIGRNRQQQPGRGKQRRTSWLMKATWDVGDDEAQCCVAFGPGLHSANAGPSCRRVRYVRRVRHVRRCRTRRARRARRARCARRVRREW